MPSKFVTHIVIYDTVAAEHKADLFDNMQSTGFRKHGQSWLELGLLEIVRLNLNAFFFNVGINYFNFFFLF